MRSGLPVYGRVGEGRGKGVRNRQRKREAEEANRVEVASGVDVGSLRYFTAALIGKPEKPEGAVL